MGLPFLVEAWLVGSAVVDHAEAAAGNPGFVAAHRTDIAVAAVVAAVSMGPGNRCHGGWSCRRNGLCRHRHSFPPTRNLVKF